MPQELMPWEKDNIQWIQWVDRYRAQHDGDLPPAPGILKLEQRYELNPERFSYWHPHEVQWFNNLPVVTVNPPVAPLPPPIVPQPVPLPPPLPIVSIPTPTPVPNCPSAVPEPSSIMLLSLGFVVSLIASRFMR